MGNSIARGMAFAMHSILNDDAPMVERTSQKEMCSKVSVTAESCILRISVPPDMKDAMPEEDAQIAINWRHAMYRSDTRPDNCGSDPPEVCYRHFFRGESRPGDVLIFNVGLGYIEGWRSTGVWRQPDHGPSDIVADFVNFLDAGLFNGTIIWTTITPAHPDKGWGGYNPDMTEVNSAILKLMLQRRQPVIDLASIWRSLPVEDLFTDAIHPPDHMYKAAVYHAMSVVCGPGGVPRPSSPTLNSARALQ